MKNLIYLTMIFAIIGFASFCKKGDEPVKCSNGYSPGTNNNCLCPLGNVEVFGQCLPDDDSILFGVSEGCPCKQDSFLMKILGRTTTPDPDGLYQLNLQFVDTTGIIGQTGMYYVPPPFGYDSLLERGWPTLNRNCTIDGFSYKRKLSGRIYGNDSLVLHFIYTRPNPDDYDKLIISPQTCKMVIRN